MALQNGRGRMWSTKCVHVLRGHVVGRWIRAFLDIAVQGQYTPGMMDASTYKDELSGVYSRTYLEERQRAAACALVLKRIPFSVVMIDIDYCKEINDTHGHLKGDDLIKALGAFLQDELRKSDAVVRYGGDEFVCFMPNTTRRDAEAIYRRILKKCKERTFSNISISLSVGVTSYPVDANDFDRLLSIADQVLNDVKQDGRGRLGTLRKRNMELPTPVFHNRRDELELLKHFLADSTAGFGVAVIKGDVGIGKTRLTKELLSTISSRDFSRPERHFEKASLMYDVCGTEATTEHWKNILLSRAQEEIRTKDVTCFAKVYGKTMNIFASVLGPGKRMLNMH